TNCLAGLIRDDERHQLDGIPGLSDIPIVGRIFSHSHTETLQTDIILMLTPHIIRVLDLNEADLRAFRVGRDSLAPITELPLPIEIPRPDSPPPPPPAPAAAPPPAGAQPPAATPPPTAPPPGATPIVPPTVTPTLPGH